MNLDALADELRSGRVRPAYLLAGEEPLLRDDALAAIRAAVLEPGAADFNFDRMRGDKTAPGALTDALAALPVMARRRLVVLDEPDVARGDGALKEALARALPDLLGQAQTVLVVLAARPDRRSRWLKAFVDPAALVECDPPRGVRALRDFVRAEARRQGVELEAAAAELLAERVGPQLLVLRQEIAKAALLALPDAQVRRSHVEATTSHVAEQPVWDLTDAIGEGRTGDALVVLARTLSAGAPPPVVLGALATHFRKLVRVRGGAAVPGPPFVVRKLERQARRYAPTQLVACLRAIHEADLALKGAGAMRPELALERLVVGLAG